MKLLLTGGHAGSTAYAFVKFLKKHPPSDRWSITFVGAQSAVEGKQVATLESIVLPKLGVTYLPIKAGRLQMKLTFWGLVSLLKVPVGLIQAFLIVKKISPDIILSFGGFVGFPVALAGYLLHIPVVVHEQTAVMGRANLWSLPFAHTLAISRESSRKFIPRYFDQNKVFVTGNPINPDLIGASI
ncbi:hypothetical protein A2188_01260 [Candidatus Woesebacteria bacterium RIFOXYA1_FULL_43_9]|uniref:Glycosyltransferase family 28 N-terminal domain-containing protein n=1 Tax=Candidatus Woesebacteria bacterium RIFOXYA1_FULL_43_9 TaxID=1802534 RepID=A0A1F8CQF8_9BACT|nr:MAG: hypothetical protein A2188_01260 [Candidatus Woesebacteria bacterium RIFOXYA1_FULL_43_9]